MKICIVVSNFYPKISEKLLNGALNLLKKKRRNTNINIIYVPGTFEIPVVVSNLVNKYDGFIVLGCVIKGETPHFDFLCTSIFNTLSILSVKSKTPIGNGILTCNNKQQAIKRSNPLKINKGGAAAEALISVLKIIK